VIDGPAREPRRRREPATRRVGITILIACAVASCWLGRIWNDHALPGFLAPGGSVEILVFKEPYAELRLESPPASCDFVAPAEGSRAAIRLTLAGARFVKHDPATPKEQTWLDLTLPDDPTLAGRSGTIRWRTRMWERDRKSGEESETTCSGDRQLQVASRWEAEIARPVTMLAVVAALAGIGMTFTRRRRGSRSGRASPGGSIPEGGP
jgi:hypothetical protein